MNLAQIEPGQSAIVKGFTENSKIRRRLQDLGLISVTKVRCISRSPLKDPTCYMIRRAVIAIRYSDAKEIIVKEL